VINELNKSVINFSEDDTRIQKTLQKVCQQYISENLLTYINGAVEVFNEVVIEEQDQYKNLFYPFFNTLIYLTTIASVELIAERGKILGFNKITIAASLIQINDAISKILRNTQE
jgi:hypothetical protein